MTTDSFPFLSSRPYCSGISLLSLLFFPVVYLCISLILYPMLSMRCLRVCTFIAMRIDRMLYVAGVMHGMASVPSSVAEIFSTVSAGTSSTKSSVLKANK